ncbi:MAG: ABC transporter permease [Flavobacteriaceae bacterium]|jgi:ABC-type lipoprotein release transport system permease subunit|nr:ABC transporter permease [Flavobacteriaceae bacterium]MBT3794819.1 ABC transporter permease [Flavobacteriaceae bacterium]MBT5011694.1 ABC transporter permease [Flavobacteriaceae bacterium]MBT5395684.1 ABC transporter permease [Flavobacteriaceae bacterium]MBT5596667.1 ABC transporter permease [Flavobacteriaceae bacterium]|tara:strand:- start:302 stop:1525 length:1224 start_codon:yes stop_codon:yes gene_type:complete
MIIKIAWRNIFRNKKRTLITIGSIFIALFLIILMRGMQFGFYENLIKTVVESYSGYIEIHDKDYWENQSLNNSMIVDKQLLNEINEIKGVENVLERIKAFSLASSNDKIKGILINGVNIQDEKLIVDWNKRMVSGSLNFNGSNQVVIGKGISKYFNLNLKDTLVLFGQGYQGMMAAGKYEIIGIVDLKNPKLNDLGVFMDIDVTRRYISSDRIVTHLVIDKEENYDAEKLASKIRKNLSNDFEVLSWKKTLPDLDQTITADSAGGLIMVYILYIVVCFGMFGTVIMMTEERRYEFGVLISLGMSRLKLSSVVLFEILILSLLGVLLAIIFTRPILIYFNNNPIDMSKLADGMSDALAKFGFDPIFPFSISWDIPLTHGLFIFIVSILMSLYPIIKIYKLNSVKSMKL